MLVDKIKKSSVVASVCIMFVVLIAHGQVASTSSRGRTSAEALRDYGIELAGSSLVASLRNPNPRIRVLAAHQLASIHDSDAVPAIKRALAEESDLMTRVGIATALASLNDPEGLNFLLATCANKQTPIKPVVASIQMIRLLGSSPAGCTGAMLDRLEEPDSVDYRDVIVPLLADLYSTAQPEQAAQIVTLLQQLVAAGKQQASTRMAAAYALRDIGTPSSLSVLGEAVYLEKDTVVRAALEDALKSLERKVNALAK